MPSQDDDLISVQCDMNGVSTDEVINRAVCRKVHGSLARTGKVKGQTPKVEAEEKKKKKSGRAARRQQYNQRFSNGNPSYGPRNGTPVSSSNK